MVSGQSVLEAQPGRKAERYVSVERMMYYPLQWMIPCDNEGQWGAGQKRSPDVWKVDGGRQTALAGSTFQMGTGKLTRTDANRREQTRNRRDRVCSRRLHLHPH